MIWALAREQVRSQKRYALSAAVVIAVTVGVAAYGALMALTLNHTQSQVDHFFGYDRETAADASTYMGFDFDDLAANIDAANADGHNVVGVAIASPTLYPGTESDVGYGQLTSLYGDVNWETMLVAGAPPQSGEVAVNAQWASEIGVRVGDEVSLGTSAAGPDGLPLTLATTLRVSGLTRSPVGAAGVQMYVPSGYVAWNDVRALNTEFDEITFVIDPEPGEDSADVGVTIYGNGTWPWNQELALAANPVGWSAAPAGAIAIIAAIGFGALVIGLIAMAFALGRSQAQARTKWVGTVRALGATKRQIAAASLLESVLVGTAAGVVGFAIGALGALAHVAIINAAIASPMLIAASAGYAAIAVAAVVLAVILALVVGAVPAFWSARVAPTAALKPVTDLSEASVSREVRVWPLATTWGVALVALAATASSDMFGPLAVVGVAATVVVLVTSVMLAHEVLRRSLPWHARRLSRSQRRAVMVAGDAILARPRQSSIPAFIVALSTTVLSALLVQVTAAWAVEMSLYSFGEPVARPRDNPYISPLIILGVYAVVTLLCVAVAVASASVTAREAATREALGLSAAQGHAAAALAYLVAQGHGLALGLVGGMTGGAVAMAIGMETWLADADIWAAHVGALFGVVIVIAGVCAAAGAAIVGAFAPRTAPISRVEVSA